MGVSGAVDVVLVMVGECGAVRLVEAGGVPLMSWVLKSMVALGS